MNYFVIAGIVIGLALICLISGLVYTYVKSRKRTEPHETECPYCQVGTPEVLDDYADHCTDCGHKWLVPTNHR